MNALTQLGLSAINSGVWSGTQDLAKTKATRLVSYDPSTEQSIAEVLTGDAQNYEQLMNKAQEAALFWREVPAPKRGALVYAIGQILRQKKEVLAALVTLETGKPKQEAEGEVQEMIDMADFAVGQSRMLYGKTMHSERPFHRLYEQWHPYGIVGVWTAFNFPVAVWAWNAFIAIICGNVVLWKPSSKTPLCAIAVHQLCQEACSTLGLPSICSVFIPQSHELALNMVDDKRLALISFTGSTPVGKKMALHVAERLGRILLELGGNNAVVVDETADLKLAIPAIVFGAVGTAGQRCTSTRRLFLHDSLYERVLDKLKKAYQSIRVGSPLDEKHHLGPLIDEKAVQHFESAILKIQSLGGAIVYGGNRIKRKGFFVEPTLVADVQHDWDIVHQETFAPILYVMPYHDLKEAIAMQNAVSQGLSSALFTQNIKHAEYYLSAMGSDCGIANINVGTSGAEIGGAFGGEKETGGGREAGSDAWKAYMRRQTNNINWGSTLPLAQGIRFEL